MTVYLPLQGPNGVKPKAPAVGAWQSPGYLGIEPPTEVTPATWVGMRCDDLVVIDCDTTEASDEWCRRIDKHGGHTWVRKTPHGFHYIYAWTPGSPEGPLVRVLKDTDVRAGRTSQIVFYAPGYEDVTPRTALHTFDPAWLPENRTRLENPSGGEWDEMPDGRGDNTMTSLAGAMRKQGMAPLTIAKCLGAINRITMTRDPMPAESIARIAMSVCRYAPDPDIDIEVEE